MLTDMREVPAPVLGCLIECKSRGLRGLCIVRQNAWWMEDVVNDVREELMRLKIYFDYNTRARESKCPGVRAVEEIW